MPRDRVQQLRWEYQQLGKDAVMLNTTDRAVGQVRVGALSIDAELLRIEAREMEIVDELRRLNVSPDVLVEAAP